MAITGSELANFILGGVAFGLGTVLFVVLAVLFRDNNSRRALTASLATVCALLAFHFGWMLQFPQPYASREGDSVIVTPDFWFTMIWAGPLMGFAVSLYLATRAEWAILLTGLLLASPTSFFFATKTGEGARYYLFFIGLMTWFTSLLVAFFANRRTRDRWSVLLFTFYLLCPPLLAAGWLLGHAGTRTIDYDSEIWFYWAGSILIFLVFPIVMAFTQGEESLFNDLRNMVKSDKQRNNSSDVEKAQQQQPLLENTADQPAGPTAQSSMYANAYSGYYGGN